jgi:DNA-directed RNA polymerase specialized sigma24 family protein
MPGKLEALVARGCITAAHCRAGIAWRGDWMAGSSSSSNRDPGRQAQGPRLGEGNLDLRAVARRRYRQAAERLGPLRRVAFAIAVEERDAGEVAEEMQEPIGAILPMLRSALGELAAFYSLTEA